MNEEAEVLSQGFGVYNLQKKFSESITAHFHSFNKIIIMTQGEGEIKIEGKKYLVEPGDVIFISAGDIHFPLMRSGILYGCKIICVTPEYLEKYSNSTDNLAECFESSRVIKLKNYGLLEKVNRLTERETIKGFAEELYRQILFLELMILLNRSMAKAENGKADEKITEIAEFIKGNLGEEMTIESLARKFYFSKYYLMRKFKSEMGVSICKYIMIRRLFKTRELLIKNNPISEVCDRSGFKDYSVFSRAFKAVFKKQPKEYREEGRKIELSRQTNFQKI